jgi:hypothetical protein
MGQEGGGGVKEKPQQVPPHPLHTTQASTLATRKSIVMRNRQSLRMFENIIAPGTKKALEIR